MTQPVNHMDDPVHANTPPWFVSIADMSFPEPLETPELAELREIADFRREPPRYEYYSNDDPYERYP